ncbi:hypothetical protein ACU8KH_03462 [Lachancea thermotolerans]
MLGSSPGSNFHLWHLQSGFILINLRLSTSTLPYSCNSQSIEQETYNCYPDLVILASENFVIE